MGYRNLRQCVDDLEKKGQLLRIAESVDAHLEAAAIHRRVCAAGGPALLFERVRDCRFPMVSNLFGTQERMRLMFRDGLAAVKKLVELKADPKSMLKQPWSSLGMLQTGLSMLPRTVRSGPILDNRTQVSQLPQLQSWPADGGPYITLPQVYTENVTKPGLRHSNLGMYRVQLGGNDFLPDQELGLHYQIHRSIGVHHAAALRTGKPFKVNIFVGGPPAMSVAAVMPLPEGMSELFFAGVLGRRRVRMIPRDHELPIHADTDFCITGYVQPNRLLPEGPFGDHLGYYSLAHLFPVMQVENVYHRSDAIWPFTVVGRPPQEDTQLGAIIHEITGPLIPDVLPGIHAVHAVDAAGVHPLLLAIGSERYTPFMKEKRPQELLTQASAILGQGQLSLAKYLLIAAKHDAPRLDIHDMRAFLEHILQRADWTRDLHFHTQTTIDTLDYSGAALNAGSKLVVAAVGMPRFSLAQSIPNDLQLPEGFRNPRLVLPGVLAVEGPSCPPPSFDYDVSVRARSESQAEVQSVMHRFCEQISTDSPLCDFRWVVVVDDSTFVAESLRNFLWVTFTRSAPATDVYGVDSFVENKHWGCRGALVIDARIKPYHAPLLEEAPETTRKVEALAAAGGPLEGIF